MIFTMSLIKRVFPTRVTFEDGTVKYGTSFLYNRIDKRKGIEYKDREYLVTANHLVVANSKRNKTMSFKLEIKRDNLYANNDSEWAGTNLCNVGSSNKNCDDVVVFSIGGVNCWGDMERIDSLEECGNLTYGQELRILGFPEGYNSTDTTSQTGQIISVPLIKGAIFSGIQKNTNQLLLDAHNNSGFSGGPVIADNDGKKSIAGVISGFITSEKEYNTGITVATDIKVVNDIIDSNPIGTKIGPVRR